MALREEITRAARVSQPVKRKKQDDGISAFGVIAPPAIEVCSPHFTGSLGMLFACVKERKIDLLDVPLFPICKAYYEYLLSVQINDLDHAAAALSALSYLLERKAWSLLPTTEEEPQSDEELAALPATIQEYESAMHWLSGSFQERELLFFRPLDAGPNPYEMPYEMDQVSVADLARALERLLATKVVEEVAPLNRPRRPLSEQMRVVIRALSKEWMSLEKLVSPSATREDVVYWFLALLELIRLGQAAVKAMDEEVYFARAS